MGWLASLRSTPEENASQAATREGRRRSTSARRAEQAEIGTHTARDSEREFRREGIRASNVLRDEYMDRDAEQRALRRDHGGLPTAVLRRVRNRLILWTADGMVNPKSTTAHKIGVYSFALRGTQNYAAAAKAGKFTPGSPVRLVREPDNAYDTNAIAVYAWKGKKPSGYVNKQNAARLAPLMDKGIDLVAISTRGGGPGNNEYVPQILVCRRRVMVHLLRETTVVPPSD
jgi:hypothetical protein